MSDKGEALRLADALQRCDLIDFDGDFTAAADLLRRQHAEIEALNAKCDALLAAPELYRGQVDQTGRHSAAEAIERAAKESEK